MTKTVLVVGASSSIGQSVIRCIDGCGYRILATYRKGKEKVEALSRDVESEIIPIEADLTSPGNAAALADAVNEQGGPLYGIIYLPAPKLTYVRFKDLTWEECRRHMDVQVGGAVELMTRLVPKMAKDKEGRVVFVLSSAILPPTPAGLAHYVMAKQALLGLMNSMSAEYAKKNVLINAVSPSMVETSYLSEVPHMVVELAARSHPLNRNASPEDIAPMIAFLLSPEAGFINGANIPITGGL